MRASKILLLAFISSFTNAVASSETATHATPELTRDVITDYPVNIESIVVRSRRDPPSQSKSAIELFVTGTITKNGRSQLVSGSVSGVSLPYPNTTSVREYQTVERSDDIILSDRSRHELATIDSENKVSTDLDWQWTVTYREYRYTVKDRLAALMFGVWVKNTQFVSIDVDPR